jgi:hypothetical protein
LPTLSEPTSACIGPGQFWERRGFVQIDRIDPMPGWQPGNPCALYVAALSPTRRMAKRSASGR